MLLYSQICLLSKSLVVFMFTVEMTTCCYRTVTTIFTIIILPLFFLPTHFSCNNFFTFIAVMAN